MHVHFHGNVPECKGVSLFHVYSKLFEFMCFCFKKWLVKKPIV